MTDGFDEARLDDPEALAKADPVLRSLAETGSRIRHEVAAAARGIAEASDLDTPRAVLAAGSDARLLRAVLEPWCPVPFVAWPAAGLPGWAGVLDLVVVLAPDGGDEDTAATVAEATRRGASVLVSAPPNSELADMVRVAGPRAGVLLPSETRDVLAGSVAMLQALSALRLGPEVPTEDVAGAADDVATACAPRRSLVDNPGKELALVLAEALPLFWGGSVLAARAARRVVEAVRPATGRAALAADARHLLPILEAVPQQDLFADPFADQIEETGRRPALIVLDDGSEQPAVRIARGRLVAAAESRRVRTHVLAHRSGSEMARYTGLLLQGAYAAAYLGLALRREAD